MENCDGFVSSSVAERVADLHEAFADPDVDGILTAIGGFNSNQLLRRVDYELIAANPKVFCGFSDITALQNAIYALSGLVTYSGPHYSTFGMDKYFDYTEAAFRACVFDSEPLEMRPAPGWSDDESQRCARRQCHQPHVDKLQPHRAHQLADRDRGPGGWRRARGGALAQAPGRLSISVRARKESACG